VLLLIWSECMIAAEGPISEEVREQVRYKTREERREAGVKHDITDWLTVGRE